jgi:FlgD Ig-like domain
MKFPAARSAAALFVLCLFALPTVGLAAWQQDGNPITTAIFSSAHKAIPDGAGGAFVAWQYGSPSKISAARINASGVALWTINVGNIGSESAPSLVSDGAGGVIVTWNGSSVIRAQRVNASGVTQWAPNGVTVVSGSGSVSCSDNAGGIIVVFGVQGAGTDLYAQRVNAGGVPQWAANGVALTTAAGNQLAPVVIADGSGGAIVVFRDTSGGPGTDDLYLQQLNSAGILDEPGNGQPVAGGAGLQGSACLATDGQGGAFFAWTSGGNVYANRLGFSTKLWYPDVQLSTPSGSFPSIIADGSFGAFIAWQNGSVQHVDMNGGLAWAAGGVAVTSNASAPSIVSDGLGGIIMGWYASNGVNSDIFARRINSSGVLQWPGAVTLCAATGEQMSPALVSDAVGGAIAVFSDARSGNAVYAQRVERNGYWGYPSANIAKVRDVPGDQGGMVNVSWDASRLDPWPNQLINTYTVWRSLSPASAAAALSAGAEKWHDDGPVKTGVEGAIRTQQINQITYYWQLIHTVNAYGLNGYSDLVPTPFDSTATSNGAIAFQVIAHATGMQWISDVATGRSVDNLAPGAPLQLTAQRVGPAVHLIWKKNHELDLDHYAIYRKTTTGVTPIQPNFLSDAQDTVLTDANAPGSSLFYIVTAIDTHDNQSAKSNETSVPVLTGVGDTPHSFTLSLTAYPNPFNPRTTVSYTVPSRGRVSVRVFDASGAFVATLFEGDRSAGAYSAEWDGRAANGAQISSGVYFARIEQNGETRTRKVVLLK